MQLFVKHYFLIQRISFAAIGIDLTPIRSQSRILKKPLLYYGPMFCSLLHSLAIIHYAYVNISDYIEVTDSLSVLCQSLLALWKIVIFLRKRNDIIQFLRNIHECNIKANHDELSIIRAENAKDYLISRVYFTFVIATGIVGLLRPIIDGLYIFFTSGQLVLYAPHKATYFWNYSHIPGYAIVYLWNCLSLYFIAFASLSIDTMFSWLICNIMVQFQLLFYRLHKTASEISSSVSDDGNRKLIITCIQGHRQALELAEKLNQVYGEIIFFKIIISCSQICCLAFRLSRSNGSMAIVIHESLFLVAVAVQLILYCYNGQRIKDESWNVIVQIYSAFDWPHLSTSCRKLLLLSMMRSIKFCQLRGVFFIVDLSLFLWVFKTAGSLITALTALDENQ